MKNVIIIIIVAVVVGGLGFYGGTVYQKSKAASGLGAGRGGFSRYAGASASGQAPTRGQILSSNGSSMTIKLSDGSSKIVLLTGSTSIMKATSGTAGDLTSGKQVMVLGTTNSDGSVTAQSVSINPQGMFRGGGGGSQNTSQ